MLTNLKEQFFDFPCGANGKEIEATLLLQNQFLAMISLGSTWTAHIAIKPEEALSCSNILKMSSFSLDHLTSAKREIE
jgi:hypothetical protein